MRWREYPEETARRELREETGLEVRLLDVIGAYSHKCDRQHHLSTLTIAFAGEVVGGSLKASIEGHPYWMDEAEMRARLSSPSKCLLEGYDAYRKSRAQG